MEKEAFEEVKPGLWEPKDSPTTVEIDKDFAEHASRELKSGSKKTDQKVKTVISKVQKALRERKGK